MSESQDGPEIEAIEAIEEPGPEPSFLEDSYLTYLVPLETNLDLKAAFQDHDRTKPISESIAQREALFFDETVDVLLVLKMPSLPKKELDSHISRLTISLEAHIVNEEVPGRDAPHASEAIFSGRLQEVANPFIVAEEQDGGEVYAMWKLPVLLARPRMRLHSPSVVFSASASLRPEGGGGGGGGGGGVYSGGGYLPSGLPSGLNLLESFGSDPSLNGIKPRLSALRVSRVAPVTRQQDLLTRLRALPQLSVNIFPILHTRVRFSRSATLPLSSAVIALLEVDFTPHFTCHALLDRVKLSTNAGVIEDLNGTAGLALPLTCVAHDHVIFLYHIKPHSGEGAGSSAKDAAGTLDISISAVVNVVAGLCAPRLSMTWNTALDFSPADAVPRSGRPAHAPTNSGQVVRPLHSPPSIRPDALPTLEPPPTSGGGMSDLGITMSFTGSRGPIHPGDIFSWTVYIVNRAVEKTAARPPRKLAFVAVPKRRRADTRLARPPSSSSPRKGDKDMADAVMDDNVLHALQRSAAVEPTDLVCLSTDARVGPVVPGACHVVELQFLALREGIVGLEAIRVVDLNSQEHVDIRDLPTTIVTPPLTA